MKKTQTRSYPKEVVYRKRVKITTAFDVEDFEEVLQRNLVLLVLHCEHKVEISFIVLERKSPLVEHDANSRA